MLLTSFLLPRVALFTLLLQLLAMSFEDHAETVELEVVLAPKPRELFSWLKIVLFLEGRGVPVDIERVSDLVVA